MTDRRRPMPLRAHHNVISLAEERRARAALAQARERAARFYFQVPPDLLTPEEIAALRRRAKETSAFARKAFAHLRPKATEDEPRGD